MATATIGLGHHQRWATFQAVRIARAEITGHNLAPAKKIRPAAMTGAGI